MKQLQLARMSIKQLVERFIEIALEQEKLFMPPDVPAANKLFWKMHDISEELKRRPNDGRHALLPLYDHPNLQVRLKAALKTLALAPAEGRRVLEAIAPLRFHPQAPDAAIALINLDRGIFKPE